MASFDILNDDVIMCILEYLNDFDKMNFLSINIKLYNFINNIWFYGVYDYKLIKELPYLERFKYVEYESNSKIIPNYVTHLTFGYYFNKNIKDCIPNSVTHLTFGKNFNKNIRECIPNSVTHLTFGWDFNQNIKGCIPNSVTHLKFGYYFNQNIKDCIPDSVHYLEFGWCFNKKIKDCIPNSVTHLIFGHCFNQNIKDCIRARIHAEQIALRCIPNSVTPCGIDLELKNQGFLQSKVTLSREGQVREKVLPCSQRDRLEETRCVYFLPSRLTHLTFGDNFNQDIRGCISDSVTHLIFGHSFNQNIKGCIPNNITHLTFGWEFYQNIKDRIPDSVTHLTLNKDFYERKKNIFVKTYRYIFIIK
ncbi:putative F-box and FNIP repeat-containing protein [Megavirus lba]|uniref:Putative F-box and FNIP repeat-containing protein n=1 Tax=Megavirus lba TaxID=1235314 RepID=L7Y386_9VIRU|nr:putative F-box and FNIP repeat-containing protein [Megavirus lba]